MKLDLEVADCSRIVAALRYASDWWVSGIWPSDLEKHESAESAVLANRIEAAVSSQDDRPAIVQRPTEKTNYGCPP